MKSILKILAFIIMPLLAMAQNPITYRDSLLTALRKAPNDTIRMDISRKLGFYYQDTEARVALPYHKNQLKIARKLDLKLWEADAYQQIAYCYGQNINLTESYKNFLLALKVAEDPSSSKNGWGYSNFSYSKSPEEARQSIEGMTHFDFSDLYDKSRSFEKNKYHLFKAFRIGEKLHNQKILCLSTRDIGNIYFREKKLDSAFIYYQKSLKYYKNSPYQKHLGQIYGGIGFYYFKKKEYDSTMVYYRKAIIESDNPSTLLGLSSSFRDLGRLFIKMKQLDSALVYIVKAQKVSEAIKDYGGIASSYKQLATVYNLRKNNILAYDYLVKANKINDSLNTKYIDGLFKFQNVDFNQKIRLQELEKENQRVKSRNTMFALITWLGIFLVVALLLLRNNRQKQKVNNVLEKTLSDLKLTQSQLIQSEKMASLGELTAGIAHEIQNPLNFVNNFSEVSNELLDEMNEELDKGDIEEAKTIAADIKQNLEKINHHGKRADAIVKGMLQHSRSSSAVKEPTDINKLADEYLRLAYHGLRAKDKSFNATMKTEFDATIGDINIIPQDIGRVILNLITNAFYATNEKLHQNIEGYEPTVTVSTKKVGDKVEVSVKDNGNGIPQKVLDKIFQPFFTTKPTGQGTGLGLSLSYDIVKAQGGELKVETIEGEGSEFIIVLPI